MTNKERLAEAREAYRKTKSPKCRRDLKKFISRLERELKGERFAKRTVDG